MSPRRKPPFQFSLRDLFWLTAAVGAVAWNVAIALEYGAAVGFVVAPFLTGGVIAVAAERYAR